MKRIISIILCLVLVMSTGAMAFASENNKNLYEINDMKAFKEALNEITVTPEMLGETSEEQEQLVAMTNPEIVNEFINQKMKDATSALKGIELSVGDGDFFHEKTIDIGDNCWIKLKIEDRSTSPRLRNYTGYDTGWVSYGNRTVTSEYTQYLLFGSAKVTFYTYYTAGANGITINSTDHSVAAFNIIVNPQTPVVSPKYASSFGSTAKSSQKFLLSTDEPISTTQTYKWGHTIKYINKDYVDNEIHRTVTWEWDN